MPFSGEDVTAGGEDEMQAAVEGDRAAVDLSCAIESSGFFRNLVKRHRRGEMPKCAITDLEEFLNNNPSQVWENSWVRFPAGVLSRFAEETFREDLAADKRTPHGGSRRDAEQFVFQRNQETWYRLPVSYLMKLALAELVGCDPGMPVLVRQTARTVMAHFVNDNTSPETVSFYVAPFRAAEGLGRGLAREAAERYLLSQLLVQYAAIRFRLSENGQTPLVYYAPLPPLRQKRLNELISDSFYRELFMSPCLSGWDRGEEKHRYMHLCHMVLSRSQLNAVAKLREAGIITSNLVVLPNISNVSLANNGTHISLGSRMLGALLSDPSSGFTSRHEKYFGDLAIKIMEHFVPLFVGTYTAAPFRLAFEDFHPERVLGFLPHELDYTHVRMIWRRWRKKASISVLGRPLTPFGPPVLDRWVSRILGLTGDWVADFRLMDYLVCLLSTDRCPALNGEVGNQERLKKDLSDQGVFDTQMAMYLLVRQRLFAEKGFSGFEGRYYSSFVSFFEDLGRAVEMQAILTALCFKYMVSGRVSHALIPDAPWVESERRQVVFGTAVGIPTFFVRKNTGNLFLKRIIGKTPQVRSSTRYPGAWRVRNLEYRKALVDLLDEEASDLAETFGIQEGFQDLRRRLERPHEYSVAGRITQHILEELNVRDPLDSSAAEFNQAAERVYREILRRTHLREAFEFFKSDVRKLQASQFTGGSSLRETLRHILGERDGVRMVEDAVRVVEEGRCPEADLARLIQLLLLAVHMHASRTKRWREDFLGGRSSETSVYREELQLRTG